ncbi:MAG: hypothetical protein FJ088_04045 [Deltaproteobacteria bacterium]|nr:hypothetical protein [Deltaproteobacteria bacterium]
MVIGRQKIPEKQAGKKGVAQSVSTGVMKKSDLAGKSFALQRKMLSPKKKPAKRPEDEMVREDNPPTTDDSQYKYEEFKGEAFIKGEGDALDIQPDDVKQGYLGDCYLVAVLGAVAHTDPDLIRNMIKDNGNGTYDVTFRMDIAWYGAEKKTVTVDSKFPTRGDQRPVYSKVGDTKTEGAETKSELWVMIIEKAWAIVKGSYKNIEGGNPGTFMEKVTGKKSDIFSPSSVADSDLIARLSTAQKNGNPVSCHTPPDTTFKENEALKKLADEMSVYANHAYSFMKVDGGKIILRNPWGTMDPKPLDPADFKKLCSQVQINKA